MQFGSYGSRYRQLRALQEAHSAAASAPSEGDADRQTVRADAAESGLPRPRHLDRRSSLRRSA